MYFNMRLEDIVVCTSLISVEHKFAATVLSTGNRMLEQGFSTDANRIKQNVC